MHYMNDKSKSVEYFLFHLLQDTTLPLSHSSLPYLNSLISEFFQHYETSMEADDVFLHGRNIVMCSHAPSKTTFYKFPLVRLLAFWLNDNIDSPFQKRRHVAWIPAPTSHFGLYYNRKEISAVKIAIAKSFF